MHLQLRIWSAALRIAAYPSFVLSLPTDPSRPLESFTAEDGSHSATFTAMSILDIDVSGLVRPADNVTGSTLEKRVIIWQNVRG